MIVEVDGSLKKVDSGEWIVVFNSTHIFLYKKIKNVFYIKIKSNSLKGGEWGVDSGF